ncbi:MMPL family transporter [Catenovulum sp. 2E275]|uniref:efflux RND transporter permease subunit n=1 Tax=Catenovulum sp. 2E275 TaxID=2980497 RepID=UPI0021D232DF|nr:MMPL family transporter [Catenovulum sp. 2E275]MCU4677580.1 MMPL family transporter [Catenovulum sp. 2E275]
MSRLILAVQQFIFSQRKLIVGFFALLTIVLAYFASQIKLDAAFTKNIPLKHPYMQTYLEYAEDFGGANRVLISVCDSSGDIYQPEFFDKLKKIHDQLFFIPGVDRAQVLSLFSPSVRFTEIVEQGFTGGPVIPANFVNDQKGLQVVKRNVEKSGQVGRLVSNDYSCAMVAAQLLDLDPTTHQPIDTIEFAKQLEQDIRGQFETPAHTIHIIGFAKMVGDVASGAKEVVMFFVVAILITSVLVYLFCHSLRLMLFPVICSVVAMIWKLGILSLLGFGLDPMSILLPFLIFAIGVSHGVQMINAIGKNVASGMQSIEAAKLSFNSLFLAGFVALLSDCIGFITILSIDIGVIQELAIAASIGVGVIILTNLILLPVLVSFIQFSPRYLEKSQHSRSEKFWPYLIKLTHPKVAVGVVITAACLFGFGYWQAQNLKVGDLHAGAPALHESSRYNQDTFLITDKFEVGVDILSVIAETEADACTQYPVMKNIDDFQWALTQLPAVQSSVSLTSITKVITAGYNEGNLKWQILPKDSATLAQSVSRVSTGTGLLNTDCSAMPIILYLADHKAETIEQVVDAVKAQKSQYELDNLSFKLASGPAGVMGATNEAVSAAQLPMMLYVYAAVFILCLLSFKSLRATIAVVLPLYIVSTLAQALMTYLQIGLTVYTLPVIALGVGIGVDYGIYILSTMSAKLKQGFSLNQAYLDALKERGSAVIFTGLTLAIGVSTWLFSALKFQVDMGVLLTFMFIVNMLAAVIILPALCRIFWWKR